MCSCWVLATHDFDSETARAMDHTDILCPHHCGVDDSRLRIRYDHATEEVSTVCSSVYDFCARVCVINV